MVPILELLADSAWPRALQGCELLLAMGQPALLDELLADAAISASGRLTVPAALRSYHRGERIALYLMASSGRLEHVACLEVDWALASLPELLTLLPGLRALHCHPDLHAPLGEGLLAALPPGLERLDVRRLSELGCAEVPRMHAALPPGCVLVVGDDLYRDEPGARAAHEASLPRLSVEPFLLPLEWEGGTDNNDTTVNLFFSLDGGFSAVHTEEWNRGSRTERLVGAYDFDREQMTVTLRYTSRSLYKRLRCAHDEDCPATWRQTFSGGYDCDRLPCGRLPSGFAAPETIERTEILKLAWDVGFSLECDTLYVFA